MDVLELPSRRIATSAGLGWRSVEALRYEDPPATDAFGTTAEGLTVVLVTSGHYRIESLHGGRWHRAAYRPGSIGVTAPGNRSVLRWRSSGHEPMESLHLHLDPGPAGGARFPDALTLHDEYVLAAARTLARAMAAGAPALYADSVAQALVLHLAHRTAAPHPRDRQRVVPLSDAEVGRVTDYMRARLSEDLTVDELASVAAVSKFHFIRAFATSTGLTPYRYLRRMRLEAAAALLRGTPDTVARIAVLCGFRSAGRFATAFRAEFGVSPTAYRR